MAKAFNLTAQLNLQGPTNLKPVINKIRNELSNIKVDLQFKVPQAASKEIGNVTKKINDLSFAAIKAEGNIAGLAKSLSSLNSSFSSVSSTSSKSASSINQIQSAVSTTTKNINESTSAIESFGKQAGLAIKRFAAFSTVTGAVLGLTNAISAAYTEFLQFNKEIVRLSQVTGSSTSDLKGVSDEITRLSTTLGVASSDLIQVTSTLAQAGLSASDTKTALEALAKSSLAPSFENITKTTEGSIAILRQFGLGAKDLEKALGSVNSVAAAFAVESSDIITAIQRTGGVFAASSKGVSEGTDALNEFIAVFTSIRATSRESAETIATGLRTIFTRIQRPKTIEELKKLGIELRDAKGQFVGTYEAVRRLSEGLNQIDPRSAQFANIAEELGGFRQIGKVIPLIQQFATAEEALGVAQRGQSSLSKDAITAQQSLAIQFAKTRENFLALVRDIGDSSSFQGFVTIVLGLTNAFIGLAGALKPLLPLLLTLTTLKAGSLLTQYSSGLFKGLGFGGNKKANGGVIGFARGGLVPGRGNGDTVPAMLSPGEFVIRKKAVETIGASNLHAMNKYATGGPVNPNKLYSIKMKDYAKNNLDNNDKIYFNKLVYGLQSTKNVKANTFEKLVQSKLAGQLIGGNFPVDIIKTGEGPVEVRNRREATPDYVLADKLMRFYLEDNQTNYIDKFTNKKNGKSDSINLGNIGIAYNLAKYKPSNYKQLNSGGLIQKFLEGGGVKDIAATQGKDIEEVILGFVKALGGIGGVKDYLDISDNDRTLNSVLRKGSISKNLDTAITAIDSAREVAERQGTIRAKAMAQAQQLAVVGFDPLDYNDTLFEKISNTDSTIHIKGLLSQYADEAQFMQQGMANLVTSGARRFQSKAIFGGNKNLAFDFDDTLVSGADIYKPGTKEIDILGYSDLNRVQEALNGKGVALTELGQALKSILQTNPDILNQIRIITARPQSNAPLLAAKLQQLGLNIPASKITGVSGSRNKPAAIGKNEKLIDDLYATVEAVRKQGGEAFPYSPIKQLSGQEKFASNLAAAEGSTLQAMLVALGASGGSIQNEDVDFKSGLGPQAASFFGVDPFIPTEVKRTISPDTIYKAKTEFAKWFESRGMASGGSVDDTVPAMLTPGEFVINKKAAQSIGYAKLNRLNKADKIQGFNRGGSVGGIQYFENGGSPKLGKSDPNTLEKWLKSLDKSSKTLEEAAEKTKDAAEADAKNNGDTGGGGIIAAQIGAEVLRGQIDGIVKSFEVLQISGVQGLLKGLQQASSASLSASIGLKAVGASAQQQAKAAAISGGLGLTAGILSGAGQVVLDDALKQTASKFSDFDKSLQDVKDATDETAKLLAQQELAKSFDELNESVSNLLPTINISETFVGLGQAIQNTTEAGMAAYQTQLALTTSLQALEAAAIKAAAANAAGAAGAGAAGAAGSFLPLLGRVASFGLKFIPILGGVITAVTLLTSVFGVFSNASKKSTEELIKLAKSAQEAAKNGPSNQLTNDFFVKTILPLVTEANRQKINLKEAAAGTTLQGRELEKLVPPKSVFRELDLNPFNRTLNAELMSTLKSKDFLGDIGTIDIATKAEKSLQEIWDDPANRTKVRAALAKAQELYIEGTFAGLQKEQPAAVETELQKSRSTFGYLLQFFTRSTLGGPNLQNKADVVQSFGNASDAEIVRSKELALATNKVVENIINFTNVLDSLDKGLSQLSDSASLSFKKLNTNIDLALGQFNSDILTQQFEEALNTLKNASKSTPQQLTQALSTSKRLLVPVQNAPGLSKEVDPNLFFSRIEANVKALQVLEKELPTILDTIAKEGVMNEAQIEERLSALFTGFSTEDTSTLVKTLTADINAVKSKGGRLPLDVADTAKINESTGKTVESFRKSTDTLGKVLETNINFLKQYGEAVKKSIDLELQASEIQSKIAEIDNTILLNTLKYQGKTPTLQQLNAPFQARLGLLTNEPNAQAIGAAIKRDTEKLKTSTPEEFNALSLTIAKNKSALELLATSTTKASNAMQKAAEVEAELTSRRNLFESLIVGQAEDPTTLLKFEGVLSSIEKARTNIASESDIVNILKNIGQFSEMQQKEIRKFLLPNYERLGGPLGGMARAFGAPEEDRQLKGFLSQAKSALEESKNALLAQLDLTNAGLLEINKGMTGIEPIRENFRTGLSAQLQGILTDIEEIRNKVLNKDQEQKTQLLGAPTGGFAIPPNLFQEQLKRFSQMEQSPVSKATNRKFAAAVESGGLGIPETQRTILESLFKDFQTELESAKEAKRAAEYEGLGVLRETFIKRIQLIEENLKELDKLYQQIPVSLPSGPNQIPPSPQNIPQPAPTDNSQFLRDFKKIFDDGSQQIAMAMAAFDAKNLKESVGEFKQSVGAFGTQVAKIPTEVQRKDEVSISFDQPLQVDNMSSATTEIGSQIMDKINTLAADLMTSQRNARLTV